jgi:hypothetical protein
MRKMWKNRGKVGKNEGKKILKEGDSSKWRNLHNTPNTPCRLFSHSIINP